MVRLWNNLSEFYNLHQILFSVTFIKSPHLTWNRFKIFSWLLTAFHDILFCPRGFSFPLLLVAIFTFFRPCHLNMPSIQSEIYFLGQLLMTFIDRDSWVFFELSSLSWQPYLLFFWERFIVFVDSWTILIFSWQDHWNMLFFLFEDGFLPRQSIAFIDKESGFVIGFSSWWWQPFLLFFCPRISLFPPLVVPIFTFPPSWIWFSGKITCNL